MDIVHVLTYKEVLKIMGHSYTGEITHDVSHYFHPTTSDQRLRLHMNSSKALTDPTLEQIMISDHPPFVKRAEGQDVAVVGASANLLEPRSKGHNGFIVVARAVSRGMGRPFERALKCLVDTFSEKPSIAPNAWGVTH